MRSILERRIENFDGSYWAPAEKEARWYQEVRKPMFGFEYVESEDPDKRGWKRYVGPEKGSATVFAAGQMVPEVKPAIKPVEPGRQWENMTLSLRRKRNLSDEESVEEEKSVGQKKRVGQKKNAGQKKSAGQKRASLYL